MADGPSAVILHWPHEFGAVEGPATALARAMAALGVRVSLLDAGSKTAVLAALPRAADYDLAICAGTPPLRRRLLGVPLHRFFGKRFFVWLLDPIIHDLNRVPAFREFCEAIPGSPRLGLLLPDDSYAELARALVGERGATVFPFGGFFDAPAPDESPREARIAVFGTIGAELARAEEETLEAVIARRDPLGLSALRRRDLAEAIQAPEAPANVAMVLADRLDLAPARILSPAMLPLVTAADAFEKRRRRLLAIRSLRDLPVDFYGKGWERWFPASAARRMRGPVPFSEIGARMQGHSVILNFDPNWDAGLHDRVYTALGNGCRVLTNASKSLAGLELSAVFGDDVLHAYRPNAPALHEVAAAMLGAPPVDPVACLRFRALQSWFARADAFLARPEIRDTRFRKT